MRPGLTRCTEYRTLSGVALDLTREERDAVIALMTDAPLEADDLYGALVRSMGVREENSRHGGLVIQALNRNGQSWRAIAEELSRRLGRHVAVSTVRGWLDPPTKERP